MDANWTSFPEMLRTTDGRAWKREDDLTHAVHINYCLYSSGKALAYYKGRQALYSIRHSHLRDWDNNHVMVCRPGRKIAEVEAR